MGTPGLLHCFPAELAQCNTLIVAKIHRLADAAQMKADVDMTMQDPPHPWLVFGARFVSSLENAIADIGDDLFEYRVAGD